MLLEDMSAEQLLELLKKPLAGALASPYEPR